LGHKWTKYITSKGKEKKGRKGKPPNPEHGNDPQGATFKNIC
jgi:hypothetical protein